MESSISENTLYYSFNESIGLETTLKEEYSKDADSYNNTKTAPTEPDNKNEEIQVFNAEIDVKEEKDDNVQGQAEEHNQLKTPTPQSNDLIKPEIIIVPIITTSKPDILENIPPASSAVKDDSSNELIIPLQNMCAVKINTDIIQADKLHLKKSDNKENKKMYVNNNRKTIHTISNGSGLLAPAESLTLKNKLLTTIKTTKFLNSPRILKSRARLTLSNVAKTTLNSPSMTRRSLAFKATTSSRKSMIPISQTQTSDKKSASKSTTTTTGKTVSTCNNENIKALLNPYTCRVCHASFKFKSLLEAHKKIHTITIKCEYCDKTFSINKALDNHLLENCKKIPPLIKKKLIQSTIINNKVEQKHHHHQQNWLNDGSASTSTPLKLEKSTIFSNEMKNQSGKKSTNFLTPQIIVPSTKSSTKKTRMSKLPFSGMYRTPTKPIICYQCDKKFLTILAFNAHSLSHSHSSLQSSTESFKEDSKQ